MNDDFLKKITASIGTFNNVKSIAKWTEALEPLSGVQKSLTNLSIDAITKSSLVSDAQYFEPIKFNPIMASFGSITKMMQQIQEPVYNPVNIFVVDLMRDFLKNQSETVSPIVSISEITSKFLNDIKFDTFNWRETYSDLFTKEYQKVPSSQYSKFNENLDMLMDLSIIDENSTLADGVIVSVNLDTQAAVTALDPVTEEIFSIANQAIEELIQKDGRFEEKLNFYLTKLWKFGNSPLTVAIISAIITAIFTVHYTNLINKDLDTDKKITELENKVTDHEIILTEQTVRVKQRGDDKSKTIDILPIGVEIEVNKRNPKWTKIIYSKNYVPQIGYCRNEELKVSN